MYVCMYITVLYLPGMVSSAGCINKPNGTIYAIISLVMDPATNPVIMWASNDRLLTEL